jgi:hypothetical protein
MEAINDKTQTCTLALLRNKPQPTFLVELPTSVSQHRPKSDWVALLRAAAALLPEKLVSPHIFGCAFRGVSIDRLPSTITTGIDVEPSTAPIFVADLDKALEYGGWPKLVLALNHACLDRTYREIGATASADEIESLRHTFPTMLTSTDGTHLWLSRFPEDSPYLQSFYESYYARWIPGDAKEALIAVFIFVHAELGGHDAVSRTLDDVFKRQ